jgi:hypothetical protein
MRRHLLGLAVAGSLVMGPGLAFADVVQVDGANGQSDQASLALTDLNDATVGLPPTLDGDTTPGSAAEQTTSYVGDTAVKASNKGLEDKGLPGGLEAQGIDSSQITGAMKFDGVMPQAANTMTNDVLGSAGLPNLTDLPGMSILK